MAQTQTQNQPSNVITYPSRIYDDTSGTFMPNLGMDQSSDNLTTVLTDKNEVLGFKDGTSQQQMEAAIKADGNGSLPEYNPGFYEKYVQQPLAKLKMSAYNSPFVTDITSSPVRAFVDSTTASFTAGAFKPAGTDQEAKTHPIISFVGNVEGSVAAFGTGAALLDGFKLTQLTPFAESIIKGGILGGTYGGVEETSKELRYDGHPDLVKIGTAVLHDGLWWGGITGVTGSVVKPLGPVVASGLGYLMAKTSGADEPTSVLNGVVLGAFHLLNVGGDSQEVRDLVTLKLPSTISDYILAKNPLVSPIVADQAGREYVVNHIQNAQDEINANIGKAEVKPVEGQTLKYPRPEKPIEDGNNPHLLNYLSQYIPTDNLVRMSATDRVALGKTSESGLEAYKQLHEDMKNLIAGEKAKENASVTSDVERMDNEGGYQNTLDQASKSSILLKKAMQNIQLEVSDIEGKQEQIKKEVDAQEEQKASEGNIIPKVAQSIEAKNIEAGLVKRIGKLPETEKVTELDQAKRSAKLIADREKLGKVIRGEEPLPEGLLGSHLITNTEKYLVDHPDEELAYELVNSPILVEGTKAGQEIQGYAKRTQDSATRAVRELQKKIVESKGGEEKVTKNKKDIVSKAKKEMEKVNLTKDELNLDKFLDEIKC